MLILKDPIYRFCSASHDEAFTDGAQNLSCNVTLYGKDLEEICPIRFRKLQQQLNTYFKNSKNLKKTKLSKTNIYFPSQETSSFQQSILFKGQAAAMTGTATTGDDYKEKEGIDYEAVLKGQTQMNKHITSITNKPQWAIQCKQQQISQKDYVNSLLGYSIKKRGKLSETIKKTIANRDAGINAIGKNLIKPEEPYLAAIVLFGNAEFVLNRKTQTMERGATTIDPKKKNNPIPAGTPTQRVLEELVLLSEFGQSVLKKQLQDKTGNVPWFRIEADLYIVEDPEAEKKRGRMPFIHVYKITP